MKAHRYQQLGWGFSFHHPESVLHLHNLSVSGTLTTWESTRSRPLDTPESEWGLGSNSWRLFWALAGKAELMLQSAKGNAWAAWKMEEAKAQGD